MRLFWLYTIFQINLIDLKQKLIIIYEPTFVCALLPTKHTIHSQIKRPILRAS